MFAEELLSCSETPVVYVLGGTDRGKTTLCRYLAERLRRRGEVAYIDCDTGQSTIGPPATIGLGLYRQGMAAPEVADLRFTGSTSPRGHFLPFLAGTHALLRKAREAGMEGVVIDPPGFVEGEAALEFQFHMIEILRPSHLIAVDGGTELEPLVACFRRRPGLSIRRFPVPKHARVRPMQERQRYRERAFLEYFRGARVQELPLGGVGVHGRLPPSFREEDWKGLLVALCDGEQAVLVLGVVEVLRIVEGVLRLLAPPFRREEVAVLHVGSLRHPLPSPAAGAQERRETDGVGAPHA